jgi:hypothetical protein
MTKETHFVNCWEFKKCGREPGGSKVSELGECSAAKEMKANGIHHGMNGGRACWCIAGTFCGGKVQGSFSQKLDNCASCNFFDLVQIEEGSEMIPATEIVSKLKEN